ncbi:hypothetical protein Ait01nite_015800 [Actinoplanes italicus]|uniref:Tetratricopeptide repeat protein n=1 Tax=Actinoplanes italicus TaxID=113567 RepID=A0A2T0KHV6_9ACTN|nr:tetratricopeptide repeat protein [Actinoplanes italicus]GIE28535.1 hypothetical protein Ait01nite_015800 [Actinoplanes italicus]
MVRLLVEHDRLDILRTEADSGDWQCGDALGSELLRRGETEAALAVYRGFAGSGWGAACHRIATILENEHGMDRAIEFLRPYADAGQRNAVHDLALLLGRQGRLDEVLTLLQPCLTDWFLVSALVEATAGGDRDDEVTAALMDLSGPHNATQSLATVLERQGRLDEAIAVLRKAPRGSVDDIERLADLLAKDGRESELRDLVAGDGAEHAAYRLADLLEEQGRVAEAVAALRPFAEDGNTDVAGALADLFLRQGRIDDATEVLYAGIRSEGGAHGCTRARLWTMLIEAGRLDEALRLLGELERDFEGQEENLQDRIWLLQELGRDEEVLALLRAHPRAGEGYWLCRQAAVLTRIGRADEAIELLRPYATSYFVGDDLAALLIRRGDVDEAMAVVRGREPLDLGPDPWAGLGLERAAQ